MPMIEMPATPVAGAEVVIERRVGEAGNRGLSPVSAVSAVSAVTGEEVMEYCQDVDHSFENSPFNGLPILHGVLSRMGYRWDDARNNFNASSEILESIRNSKVTVIAAPQHGTVKRDSPGSYFWRYTPHADYRGKDKVTFLVETQGRRFRITANLLVHAVVNENANPPACEKAFIKKGAPKPLGQVRIDQLAIQIGVPHVRSQL
ncbi:MAG TPA: Ig-like domain-containing protein [Rhodocyclaceae bacterium]|nr:Ig-like domain-containing protein [Rhodocyclaceae bacterium]